MKRPRKWTMPDRDEPPRADGGTAMDRFMRFGRALFAVKKDDLPKREESGRGQLQRKKAKRAT